MREKYLILILVMLIATAVFVMLSGRALDKNNREISMLDKQIKESQEQLNSARILDQELSQFARILENSLTQRDVKGFSFDEINDFKTKIGDLAHQRKISINKMSDTNKWALPHLIESTYNLELEATFVQIGQFISDLESQDNIIKIQTLDISPVQITGDEPAGAESRYRVQLELSIFKVKKEA